MANGWPPTRTIKAGSRASRAGRRRVSRVPRPGCESRSTVPLSWSDLARDHVHPHPSAGDVVGLRPGREPRLEDQRPESVAAGLLVRAEPAQMPGLGRDGLFVQPLAIVLDGDDQGIPLAMGLERDASGGWLAEPDSFGRVIRSRGSPRCVATCSRGSNARSWTARSTPVSSPTMTTSTCRPSTRAASCSTRQTLKQAPDRDDPERLEGIPELKRNADQGISAVDHRRRGGPRRFRQDGQVARLLRQAAELSGQICPGIDQPVVDSGPLAPGRQS